MFPNRTRASSVGLRILLVGMSLTSLKGKQWDETGGRDRALGWSGLSGFPQQQQAKEGLGRWMMSSNVAGIQIVPWRLLWMALPPLHSCGLVGHIYHLSVFYSFSLPKDPLIITERFSWSWISLHSRDVGSYTGPNTIHPYLAQRIKGDLYTQSLCLCHHEALLWLASVCYHSMYCPLVLHVMLETRLDIVITPPNWENPYVKGSLLLWFEYKMIPTQSSYFQYLVPRFWYYLCL